MKKFCAFLPLVLPCLLLASCQSANLLLATFESDTTGSRPATDLAGDPAGDVIQYNPGIGNQLVVEASTTTGEKALHFRNAPVTSDIGRNQKWLNFRGINSNMANTLWFTHTATNASATGDVYIDVTDGFSGLIARMRIRPGGEVGLARTLLDADYSDVIGRLTGTGHTIIFTVDVSRLRYNVSIFQTGGATIPPASDRPMITTNPLHFRNPANPSLSFYHAGGANPNHRYIIESVIISKEEPD